ncbi:MAG: phage shock protein operon transcriptional activator [Pseudomonadales bacterium]
MHNQTIIGESALLNQALEQLSHIAPLQKPVLIIGERGTGKELIAERLHFLSLRWEKPFLKLNCAALSDNLLESTLFGHEAGAFTGATKSSRGYFERASEGTLFLDELATVSTRVQEKLLRVIEYGEFERLGGQQPLQCDVRIVAATNADLPAMSAAGEFRADLLDRLAFDVINLAPLRYRQEDILLLAESFAIAMSRELEREVFHGFSTQAQHQLLSYSWPGNIRELKNAVQRSVYRQQDADTPLAEIVLDPFATPWQEKKPVEGTTQALPVTTPPEPENCGLKAQVSALEQQLIASALRQQHYHQSNSAKALGISYHQMRAYLKKYPHLLTASGAIRA